MGKRMADNTDKLQQVFKRCPHYRSSRYLYILELILVFGIGVCVGFLICYHLMMQVLIEYLDTLISELIDSRYY